MTEENDDATVYVGEDFEGVGAGTVYKLDSHADDTEDAETLDTYYDDPDLPSHSPNGFQCGYGGSGPAQLAAAILYDVTGDAALTNDLYQEFKHEVVSSLPNEFTVFSDTVEEWVERHKTQQDE